ncbi:DUF3316 domain-containing protein [Prevotella melaninogenica]|uniref:DUF3316 domain-containing protein n=1 Tax=Prevotella melaninogenica TaxID=28132 RepID=A0ABS6Y908_9BACT|nr:DUF3316 domain-containing protein [Prevotella melaninogenica]MBW4755150.1 DUF3316 domain-containing protein [Prevotella melaninogenica]
MNLKKSLFRCFSLSAIILFALSSPTLAQDTLRSNKVITNTQMLGIGAVNTLDTYLSPEEYTGTELRYISHSVRENGTKLSRELVHQAQILSVRNRRENNYELGGFYNFQYNWQYALGQWNVGEGELRLKVGGGVDTRLGFLYNMRNSNNPAQAYGQVNIAPNAVAAYRFRLRNLPFQLRYEVQVPLLGLAFSPNYGQSYYEIFTHDNYDHNLVVTSPVSAPSLRQQLTLDFTVRHTTFRVGYLGDYQQAKINQLRQHVWSNLLVLGIVRKFSINKFIP